MHFRIYTLPNCPHCESAVNLMEKYDLPYVSEPVNSNTAPSKAKFETMAGRPVNTAPVILLASDHAAARYVFIGGSEDLVNYFNSFGDSIQKFKSQRVVGARPMKVGDFVAKHPSRAYLRKDFGPDEPGFLVVYEPAKKGDPPYQSWCPAGSFIRGYDL